MKKIKGRKIVSEVGDAEIEYKLKNGLIASVIWLKNPLMKMLFSLANHEGKEFSVEIINKAKKGKTRIVVEGARQLDYDEMVDYLNEVEKK